MVAGSAGTLDEHVASLLLDYCGLKPGLGALREKLLHEKVASEEVSYEEVPCEKAAFENVQQLLEAGTVNTLEEKGVEALSCQETSFHLSFQRGCLLIFGEASSQ